MAITTFRPAAPDQFVASNWSLVPNSTGQTYGGTLSDDSDTTYARHYSTLNNLFRTSTPNLDAVLPGDRIKRIGYVVKVRRDEATQGAEASQHYNAVALYDKYRKSYDNTVVAHYISGYQETKIIRLPWKVPPKELSVYDFNGDIYHLQVNGQSVDATAALYVYEVWIDLEHFPPPRTGVVNPANNSFVGTTSPVTEWTYDHPDFEQLQYRVQVYRVQADGSVDFDSVIYDSDIVQGSSTSHTIDTDLQDGVTYRVYVQVAADWKAPYDPLWSSWEYSEFTIDATSAALPTIAVERHHHANIVSLRDNSTSPVADEFRIEKKTETEDTWYTVRDAEAIQADSILQAVDVELRPNETTEYRARSVRYTASGDIVVSQPTNPIGIFYNQNEWLLKDLLASLPVFPTQPTFTRASTAYLEGIEHASGAARFPNGNSILIEEGTTNLLTANQSSVETDVTEWGVSDAGTAISRIITDSWHGSACMRVVADGSIANQWARTIHTTSTQATYIGSAYVKWVSGAQPFVQIEIEYTDGTFAWRASPVVGTDGTWQRLVTEPFTTDSAKTVANVKVYVQENASAAAFEVRVDGIQLEQKAYATSWQIGGTTRQREDLDTPEDVLSASEGTITFDVLASTHTQGRASSAGGGYWNIATWGNPGSTGFLLRYDPNGILQAQMYGSSPYPSINVNNAMLYGQTMRISLVWSADTARLWVNGVEVGSVAVTMNQPASTETLRIGGRGTEVRAGLIFDAVRTSSRDRTDEELADYTAPLETDEDTTYLLAFKNHIYAQTAELPSRGERMHLDVEQHTLDQESTEAISRFQPLGAPGQRVTYPIVVKDAVHSEQFGVTLGFIGRLNYEKFKAIRKAQRVVLLTAPMREGFWYAVFDSPMRDRLINMNDPMYRQVTVGVIEVDKP